MNGVFTWIISSTLVVCLSSLVGIFALVLKSKVLNRLLLCLVGFSAGALMGGAFLHLLPESIEKISTVTASLSLLVGFSSFFLIERFLHWHHCHKNKCEVHTFTYMNLFGDGVHNFIDGVVIAVSFVTDIHLGIVTTIAIIAHEVPQEIGDFGVLIYGGFTKAKAILYNFLSALTALLGALSGYFLSTVLEGVISSILPFAAGGFIYIAASDLIPELHKEPDFRKSLSSFCFFIAGISFMLIIKVIFEH
ncbi:ZIP family metal transporter [Candidatus Woesearchaeota archaeon]|nr:ZIP family metal transporter [Candidatus Woesearchaeota archaeon]